MLPHNSFSRPRRAPTRLTAGAPSQQQPDYGPPQAATPVEVSMPEDDKPAALSPFMNAFGAPQVACFIKWSGVNVIA